MSSCPQRVNEACSRWGRRWPSASPMPGADLQGNTETGGAMKDNMRRRAAELVQRVGPHRVRPRQVARRLFLALAAMTFVGGLTPVLASETAGHPAIGDTAIFASVPAPGHPFGVAVDKDRVYVSTSDGDFYAQHLNTQGERVFAYDLKGNLVRTIRIATKPVPPMGLFALALDTNPPPTHRLYLPDIN